MTHLYTHVWICSPLGYSEWIRVETLKVWGVIWCAGPGWCDRHEVRREHLGSGPSPKAHPRPGSRRLAWVCPRCLDEAASWQLARRWEWTDRLMNG